MRKFLLLAISVLLAACTSLPAPETRRDLANALAARKGWQRVVIPSGTFELTAYVPRVQKTGDELTVYIEGDGFAWVSPSQPSGDPTPINPIGLKLALAHIDGNAVYLARPCQYGDAQASKCEPRYWMEQRFAPEVIESENKALDVLKAQVHARELTLVGYSGGGAVAALLAARRNDVTRLITVAGNLDHAAWTRHHQVLQLTGSLNPADEIDALKTVRQWHFVGGQDKIVPPSLVETFANRFPSSQRPMVIVEPSYTHDCRWAENWARLLEKIR
jgi:dienelactone hydrolase